MAAGSSTHQSFRRAIGALKDSTKVGLAKVNGDNKRLNIAIVKATKHNEVLPKEKHIRTIFIAASASSPRSDVAFCIHSLAKRLSRTHNWTVALKTLIVVHRALRELDPTFRDELIKYSMDRGYMLNLAHFKDDSSPQAWYYSSWVRAYALYLEERLECFQVLKYDLGTDKLRTKELDNPNLLEKLPVLQHLQSRLLACKPEGAALTNSLIHYALSIVAGECVKLYVTITDGILNMVDKYFEMPRHHAVKALEIYQKTGIQSDQLSEFFEICRGLDFGLGQKYIKIEPPPASFITAMKDYVKEAPQALALPSTVRKDDHSIASKETTTAKSDLLVVHKQHADIQEQKSDSSATSPDPTEGNQNETASAPQIGDLLCLDDPTEEVPQVAEKNFPELDFARSENRPDSSNTLSLASQTTSWELALVSEPSSNGAAGTDSRLADRLDKLKLDSLYEEAATRTANQNGVCNIATWSSNPFDDVYDDESPFYASATSAPATDFRTSTMAQQQTSSMQQLQQKQAPIVVDCSTNPFGNPFLEQSVPSHQPQNSYASLI